MIGFLLRAHRRWFRFLKHHVWGDAKRAEPKPIVKKVKVEILRIDLSPSVLGHASIVCKINGHEMMVPMTAQDKSPKEAIEYWLNYLSRKRRESQEVLGKAKGWKGKKFEVEV